MDRSKSRPKPAKTVADSTVMMPARKNTDMEGLAASATALQRRIQQVETDRKTDMAGLQEQLKQMRELLAGNDATHRDMADMKARIEAFGKRVEEVQSHPTAPNPRPMVSAPSLTKMPPPLDKVIPRGTTGAEPQAADAPGATDTADASKIMKPAVQERKLRVIGAGDASAKSADGKAAGKTPTEARQSVSDDGGKAGGESTRDTAEKKKPADSDSVYAPMGSMIQGVLLNGLDAPTSGAAQKNPTPVLIRVKQDAILPNRAKMDVKECFIIASGFGVMSTERANLRTEGISCVRDDGGVIETNLSGYVIGEDGKVGMRGRLVSKQGSMIAQSLLSGFLSGIGKAITPTGVVGLNLNPGSMMQTQSPDLGTAFESGVLGGASNTLNQISKFYLDIAKEMVPVVEIDAGRPVTIVLTRGGNLRLNRK